MLDILEIAREKGLEEGEAIGIQKGKAIGVQEILTDILISRFETVPSRVMKQIMTIKDQGTLKMLCRQALKCKDIMEFEAFMKQVIS